MLIIVLIGVIVMLLDQITKLLVIENMELYENKEIIKGFFSFYYCRNDGIAWGIDVPLWILIIITIIAISIFLYFAAKNEFKTNKWLGITIGFLFGGTIGNFLDRIFQRTYGGVIDFLSVILYYPWFDDGLKMMTYDFPIFNIADSFLVVGGIMLIIYIMFIEPKKIKKEESKDEVINI